MELLTRDSNTLMLGRAFRAHFCNLNSLLSIYYNRVPNCSTHYATFSNDQVENILDQCGFESIRSIPCSKNSSIQINGNQLCNGKSDCPDGEDETECENNENILENILKRKNNSKLGNNFKCIKTQKQYYQNQFKIINYNNWLLVKGEP